MLVLRVRFCYNNTCPLSIIPNILLDLLALCTQILPRSASRFGVLQERANPGGDDYSFDIKVTMPEKMVYEWDDKRDACYVMYIMENKSLDEIMEFYKNKSFAPRYVVDSLRQPAARWLFWSTRLNLLLPCAVELRTLHEIHYRACGTPNVLHELVVLTTIPSQPLSFSLIYSFTKISTDHYTIVSGLFRRISKNGNFLRSIAPHTRKQSFSRESGSYGRSTRETSRCTTS